MISSFNTLGKRRKPFIFIIDFDLQQPIVMPINEISSEDILYDINGYSNVSRNESILQTLVLKKKPIPFSRYKEAFDYVIREESYGNSYLLNLTFPTHIEINGSLKDIFFYSKAKYRLWYKEQFVVFSPETFICINNGLISSFPMKGTIDASLPNAATLLLENEKEKAEHATIVDLIRNDMSRIANDVIVKRFRYIEEIQTTEKRLLQVSSEISGTLPPKYYEHIGDILFSMLPAGSVTGAPKNKTIEIIKKVEGYKRGYYTGVFGYFDGHKLDSAVMIRFIEKDNDNYFFKSGGGITTQSNVATEYQEMIDKVYVQTG